MRTCSWLLTAGLIILTAGPATAQQGPQARPGWEYKALSRDEVEDKVPRGPGDRLAAGLERMAREGWELVEVLPKTADRGALYLLGRAGPRGRPVANNGFQVVGLKNADAAGMVRTLSAVFPEERWGLRFLADDRTNSIIIAARLAPAPAVFRLVEALDVPAGPAPGPVRP